LITLKEKRNSEINSGGTYFIAGNHDFAFGAFLGILPTDKSITAEQLDAGIKFITGANFYPIEATSGIHF
jgi:hypothetical protein